jgi:cysteinyl-tRNA synthetase
MSNHYLGPTFDIHGGGKDLLFPHHENERAQSIGAMGGHFANYWVHNGFVTVESEKMSKSLGNFLTIRDALKSYHPEVLRLFLLSRHYRSPLDFSKKTVLDLQSGLVRIYRTLQRLGDVAVPMQNINGSWGFLSGDQRDPFLQQFVDMMDDDLNTAGAMGLVFEKVREMNKLLDSEKTPLNDKIHSHLENDAHQLFLAARVLGILHEQPEDFFRQLAGTQKQADPAEIEKLIEDRIEARAAKDWAKADEIRERLKGLGVILEDGPQGTTWRLDV